MMRRWLFPVCLFCMSMIQAQQPQQVYRISGRVVDFRTHQPLAFVNMVINNTQTGGTTDIDGKFRLTSDQKIVTLTLSYVGYETLVYHVGSQVSGLTILLEQGEIELSEVEILPGINPAHRIIRNAIENREMNDPEKLSSFSYTMYDKTVFTVDIDTTVKSDFSALYDTSLYQQMKGAGISIVPRSDSIKNDTALMDSAQNLIKKIIKQQYLFLMENVTLRKFMAPDRSYNKVIATKMSGFKDPIFVFLTTQIQSFSFYKPYITIFTKNYVNPIGTGSLSKYFFKLQDTLYQGKDTVYVISFRPRKGTNFDGMKGLISINTNKWAIQNVSATPYEDNDAFVIRIHQMYELVDGEHWFPVQLNTDVAFNNLKIGKYKAIGSGRSYIKDIVLNPEMVRREFNNPDIDVVKEATTRTDAFWNIYRTDSLTSKDRKTYQVLDSIGKANNFDKMAKTFQTLLSGRIPWKFLDFDLSRVLGYNFYEGIILGLGIHTNDRLSKWFRIGGFYQYSFAISTSKYGGDVSFLLNRRHEINLSASYYYDLIESGGTSFPNNYESILSGNFRPLMIKKLDRTEYMGLSFSFRAFKYWLWNAGASRTFKTSTSYDLATIEGNVTLLEDQFRFTEVTGGFKFAYGEKFIQTIENKISLGTNYPVLWLQYTHGFKDVLDGEYDYNRVDLKLKKTFTIKFLGKLTFQLNAGYVDQPIPACNLYNGNGSFRTITLFAPYSFATMRMNEFLSNKYAALYIYHDFGYLLFKGKKWFHPEFAIAQNIGFGWLDEKERYAYYKEGIKTMDLGYYESGLLINNLVNLQVYKIGIGAFYRWGPYSLDKVGNNFAYKISLIFPF